MEKLLGITIYKKLTDAEFVEKQRKNLDLSKRFAWIYIIVVGAFCILIPKFYHLFQDLIQNLPDDAKKLAWSGFYLGIVMGLILSSFVFKAAESIIRGFNILNFNRSTRLLIKYHDLLVQMGKEK
jgi:hypothetical protein